MAKKKLNPQEELLKAQRAMRDMGDDRRWSTPSPVVRKVASYGPTQLFRGFVNSLADATSQLLVGAAIDKGDYIDTNQQVDLQSQPVVQAPEFNDSVAVGEGNVEVPRVANEVAVQTQSVPQPVVKEEQSVEVDSVSFASPESVDTPGYETEEVQYVSAQMPQQDAVPAQAPVTQQEVAAASEPIDVVQPAAELHIEQTPVEMPEQETPSLVAPPIIAAAQVARPQMPPPVAVQEPQARLDPPTQQFPQVAVSDDEPVVLSDSQDFDVSVPVGDSDTSTLVPQLNSPPVPQQVMDDVRSEAVSRLDLPPITVDRSVDTGVPQINAGVSSVSLIASVNEGDSQGISEPEEFPSGGQVRHDVNSGKREAGEAKHASTRWNPDGTRTPNQPRPRLSSGAEYDPGKPAGDFVGMAMPADGATPHVEMEAEPANQRDAGVEAGDSLASSVQAYSEMQGEIMERMGNAIADLMVRLNHVEMTLRRVGA